MSYISRHATTGLMLRSQHLTLPHAVWKRTCMCIHIYMHISYMSYIMYIYIYTYFIYCCAHTLTVAVALGMQSCSVPAFEPDLLLPWRSNAPAPSFKHHWQLSLNRYPYVTHSLSNMKWRKAKIRSSACQNSSNPKRCPLISTRFGLCHA